MAEAIDVPYNQEAVFAETLKLARFLKDFLPLANAHNNDFFVDCSFEKYFPEKIRLPLLKANVTDLETGSKPVMKIPLEDHYESSSVREEELCLQSVFPACSSSSHGPKPKWDKNLLPDWSKVSSFEHFVSLTRRFAVSTCPCVLNTENLLHSMGVGQIKHPHVDQGMSQKKSHEVEKMVDVCGQILQACCVNQVVDIGSGRGYLGCHLALTYNVPVVGIDSCSINTNSAKKRLNCISKYWNGLLTKAVAEQTAEGCAMKVLPKEKLLKTKSNFTLITDFISPDSDLQKLLQQSPRADGGCYGYTCLLTGLHTCGNLASDSLRLFVNSLHAHVICTVGCCYHHLDEEYLASPFSDTEGSLSGQKHGFPMSALLKNRHYQLGRNARMLACQSLERHSMLSQENYDAMVKSLFWRAALQLILTDMTGASSADWRVGRLPDNIPDFRSYVRACLSKLRFSDELSDEQIDAYESKLRQHLPEFEAYFAVRRLLAPCIEGLILLDRLAYLLEQEEVAEAYLVQIFKPVISPRCHALVSRKKTL